MRTSESFFDYLGRVDVHEQVENDIRILTKKNKKKNNKAAAAPKVKVEEDTYEQAMDTSKYNKILSELAI
jgi:hypothetical protein